jgi:hypothetical protein
VRIMIYRGFSGCRVIVLFHKLAGSRQPRPLSRVFGHPLPACQAGVTLRLRRTVVTCSKATKVTIYNCRISAAHTSTAPEVWLQRLLGGRSGPSRRSVAARVEGTSGALAVVAGRLPWFLFRDLIRSAACGSRESASSLSVSSSGTVIGTPFSGGGRSGDEPGAVFPG